jgi:putative N-acetylmannosamine-6-phosphate epimerase
MWDHLEETLVPNSNQEQRGKVLSALKGQLIVSCQANPGDPMDSIDTIVRMARSVLRGGAAGLRAEGASSIKALRAVTDRPLIGIVKSTDSTGDVYITPTFEDAKAVWGAGANVIALDCTLRRLNEAEPWPEMIRCIHTELGAVVLADVASLEDAIAAQEAGADAVATTLYGYTAETIGVRQISWPLLQSLIENLQIPVIAEGHIQEPAEVRRAIASGAHAVVVGSAITRPEWITNRFVAAIRD